MTKPESPKTRQYQQLWLKATETPVQIPCKDKATATLVRFQLYHAVKKIRDRPEGNPELASAVTQVSATILEETPGGKAVVRLGKSEAAAALEAALENLGIAAEPAAAEPTEADFAAALQRLGEIQPDRVSYSDVMGKLQKPEAG
jgi:hypothetical protein